MGSTWKLQDAKNRFSEVVNRARRSGPQFVTRRGEEAAVVLSVEDYRRLTGADTDLVEFFQSSVLCGAEIDLSRSKEAAREVEL